MPDTSDAVAAPAREQRISRTFVALADSLVDDFDIAEFLDVLTERAVELLSVTAAGVILLAPDGRLEVLSSTSRRADLLEQFAVEINDGPCVECTRRGVPVTCADLEVEARRWPRFAAAARECGFRAAHALPMRLRKQTIGALSLLGAQPGSLEGDQLGLGQALADVATIAILQQRSIEHGDRLSSQLQTALNTRVVIEQAKGVLAQRAALSMDEAFALLRGHARARSQRLVDLATAVVANTADLDSITLPARPPTGRGEGRS
ncbi:GAF and ANTAR domain-containing protein [Actinokineospora sp. NBRC 105648]|uniref:GAF and ANTAR domain-containing protein n=1 Tax=Actinokineospora sp. NBRC 105648 TaxID=3032206 RepID=UPI0024A375FE|nr:GAF and ANTAR domain-containing protein [Actinokineospora sp. NBRC 105648]GLZ38059.1 transcriptional regulator [Actinokineospora sp. NBRC 105648]